MIYDWNKLLDSKNGSPFDLTHVEQTYLYQPSFFTNIEFMIQRDMPCAVHSCDRSPNPASAAKEANTGNTCVHAWPTRASAEISNLISGYHEPLVLSGVAAEGVGVHMEHSGNAAIRIRILSAESHIKPAPNFTNTWILVRMTQDARARQKRTEKIVLISTE